MKIVKLSIITVLLLVNSYAEEQKYNGDFHQYDDKYEKTEQPPKKNSSSDTVLSLLKKILNEEEKQTKLQTQIRDILKNQYDPQPKTITNEYGEKCIENSSVSCFSMPVTLEAKKVPVLANFLSNPTPQSAKDFALWQSKYMSKINNIGSSLYYANINNANMLETGFMSEGSIMPNGYTPKKKFYKKVLNEIKPKIKVAIALGLNESVDVFSIDNINDFANEYGDILDMSLVFSSEKSKELYDNLIKTNRFNTLKNIDKKVSKKLFDNINIYTTPMLMVIDKATKQADMIAYGRKSASFLFDELVNYLQYKKYIKNTKDYDMWSVDKEYTSEYMQRKYNIKLEDTNGTK